MCRLLLFKYNHKNVVCAVTLPVIEQIGNISNLDLHTVCASQTTHPMDISYQHKLVSEPFTIYYLAPGGGCEVLFSPGLSVCLCVCPANILVFYFSAIIRDIDLKFIQDTYRVVLNSLNKIDLHRSKVKVTGTVHCFLKVQSYHKN